MAAAPSSPVPCATLSSEMTYSDGQLRHLLDPGYELAATQLEGINEGALELADAAGGDRRVMERACRVVAERVRVDPSHANDQVASLIRRAVQWACGDGTGMTHAPCRNRDVPPRGSRSRASSFEIDSRGLVGPFVQR